MPLNGWDIEMMTPTYCRWCGHAIEFGNIHCGIDCEKTEKEYYYHPANVII
jgi:hypothetical protein